MDASGEGPPHRGPDGVGAPADPGRHQEAQTLKKMGLRVTEVPGASFEGADAGRTMRGQCLAEGADPRAAAAK